MEAWVWSPSTVPVEPECTKGSANDHDVRRVLHAVQRRSTMENASFYADAANVLSDCHTKREDLAAVLDPQAGFAPRLSEMCKKR